MGKVYVQCTVWSFRAGIFGHTQLVIVTRFVNILRENEWCKMQANKTDGKNKHD